MNRTSFDWSRCACAAVLAAAMAGCGGPTGPGGGGGGGTPGLGIVVEGSVKSQGGEVIDGSTVEVRTYLYDNVARECGTQPIGAPGQTTVNEEGDYSLGLTFEGNEEFDACLRIDAIPPAGFGYSPQFTLRTNVEVRRVGQDALERVRADFALAS